jgi:hypothetical protein
MGKYKNLKEYKTYDRETEGGKTFSVICSKLWNMLERTLI